LKSSLVWNEQLKAIRGRSLLDRQHNGSTAGM
jgi:hypothetical protein